MHLQWQRYLQTVHPSPRAVAMWLPYTTTFPTHASYTTPSHASYTTHTTHTTFPWWRWSP